MRVQHEFLSQNPKMRQQPNALHPTSVSTPVAYYRPTIQFDEALRDVRDGWMPGMEASSNVLMRHANNFLTAQFYSSNDMFMRHEETCPKMKYPCTLSHYANPNAWCQQRVAYKLRKPIGYLYLVG